MAFDAAFEAVLLTTERRDRLDAAIEQMAMHSSFTDVVVRLGCLRGISTLTGFGLASEIGNWDRFTGSTIGAYLGLVPTESSSGQTRSQGSITKTGNGHARRLLVEAAWHHRRGYRVPGATMQAAGTSLPPPPGPAGIRATIGFTPAGWPSPNARRSPSSRTSPSPANSPAGAGPWPSWTTDRKCPVGGPRRVAARGTTRVTTMSSNDLTVDATLAPRQRKRSSRTVRPAVTNPRISV